MKPSKQNDVEIKAPSSEDWENIVRDLKLTPVQQRTLKDVLSRALDDIGRYHQKLKDQPNRELLVRRLTRFTRMLGHLRDECERSVDLMQHFLPNETLAYIGQSLTFSAMSKALERDVFPGHFDMKIDRMRATGELITLASLDQVDPPAARSPRSQIWQFDPEALDRADTHTASGMDRIKQAEQGWPKIQCGALVFDLSLSGIGN
jgi:hypothetical protein